MNSNRDDSISIAKGIGIILMVLGHTHFSKYGNAWVSMVHMPLFFFFSGYCFKEKYIGHFLTFLRKRIKGLYRPGLKWGLLFLALHNLFFDLNLYTSATSSLYTSRVFFMKACYIITTMTHYEELLGGYWFLRTLFWCSIISYWMIVIIKPKIKIGVALLLVMSVFMLLIDKKVPYFDIGARELIASSFFLVGYDYRRSNFKWEKTKWIIPIAITLITIGTFYWRASMGWFQSMTWWKVLPYVISALFGTIAIYATSLWIKRCEKISIVFTFIGEHTLEILTWHLLCFKLVSLAIVVFYNLNVSHLADFPVIETYSPLGWWTVYLFVGCGLPLITVLAIKYVKRYIGSFFNTEL